MPGTYMMSCFWSHPLGTGTELLGANKLIVVVQLVSYKIKWEIKVDTCFEEDIWDEPLHASMSQAMHPYTCSNAHTYFCIPHKHKHMQKQSQKNWIQYYSKMPRLWSLDNSHKFHKIQTFLSIKWRILIYTQNVLWKAVRYESTSLLSKIYFRFKE